MLWLKVLHILGVVAWMAGLFYLPRLFVYHVSLDVASAADELFKVMERRLLIAIMRPAAVVTLVAGAALVNASGYDWASVWLSWKLLGVIGLVAYHLALERYRILFSGGWRGRSDRYFRVLNEVPTLLLIWIVIWVVVKPFS